MNLQEVIERERWDAKGVVIVKKGKATRRVGIEEIEEHNKSLDRIAEAAKKPRVMKRWTEDCKPEKEGVYWINKEGLLISVDNKTIKSGLFRGHRITHWLEVEPQPILPEDK
jgi:hypothetical protein